jgi:hypothetical protein
MPGRLRVTIGTPQENAAFLTALEALLPQWRLAPGPVTGEVTAARGQRADRAFVLDLGRRTVATTASRRLRRPPPGSSEQSYEAADGLRVRSLARAPDR